MATHRETLEEGCFGITFERKYYERSGTFIKRCLRPKEFRTGYHGLYVPRLRNERLKNEAASLRYVKEHTDIPVPVVYCDFEDDEAYYLITEYIPGINMADLEDEQKETVKAEVQRHLRTLRTLKSSRLGGPNGIVIPPYRVHDLTKQDVWTLRESDTEEYVFCHNDLSQHNILVDPATLKITGIIDWEYAGFWPQSFERHFFERKGPSAALDGESDDSQELLDFLKSQEQVR